MDDHQVDCAQSSTGALLRLYWMFFGLFPLPALLLYMAMHKPESGLPDGAFFAGLFALIAVRYADIRFYGGLTGEGKPATLSHWKRYSLLIGTLGAAGWLASRFVFA